MRGPRASSRLTAGLQESQPPLPNGRAMRPEEGSRDVHLIKWGSSSRCPGTCPAQRPEPVPSFRTTRNHKLIDAETTSGDPLLLCKSPSVPLRWRPDVWEWLPRMSERPLVVGEQAHASLRSQLSQPPPQSGLLGSDLAALPLRLLLLVVTGGPPLKGQGNRHRVLHTRRNTPWLARQAFQLAIKHPPPFPCMP